MKTSRRTPNQYLFAVAHQAIKAGQTREAFLAQFRPNAKAAAARHFDHLIADDRAARRSQARGEG
jgi:hypothetical protein